MGGASKTGHNLNDDEFVIEDMEKDDAAMAELPPSVKHFLWYDAEVPFSAIQMVKAKKAFWLNLTWRDILNQSKAYSRALHIEAYGGKRPEDG